MINLRNNKKMMPLLNRMKLMDSIPPDFLVKLNKAISPKSWVKKGGHHYSKTIHQEE
jgi:hypothetical protein